MLLMKGCYVVLWLFGVWFLFFGFCFFNLLLLYFCFYLKLLFYLLNCILSLVRFVKFKICMVGNLWLVLFYFFFYYFELNCCEYFL